LTGISGLRAVGRWPLVRHQVSGFGPAHAPACRAASVWQAICSATRRCQY